MEQWVSLITLFVSDLEKPVAFHSVLGWQRELGEEGVVAFNLIGQTLGLYPRADLAVGFGIHTAAIGRFSGIFLSYNTPQKSEVAPLLERVATAGGQIIKSARDVIWGGSRGIGLGCAVYCASKHAVEGMTKSMAIEWGHHNIRVNTICPTFIRTPLTELIFSDPEKMAWVKSKIKLSRTG